MSTNPSNEFQAKFVKLNCFKFEEAKKSIIEKSMISIQTWNNWWNGTTTPKDAVMKTIDQIIAEYEDK